MGRRTKRKDGLSPAEVQAWFTTHGATMRVVEQGTGGYYVADNEHVFVSADGKSRLTATVSYTEGCPTCGGAYVKTWEVSDA